MQEMEGRGVGGGGKGWKRVEKGAMGWKREGGGGRGWEGEGGGWSIIIESILLE